MMSSCLSLILILQMLLASSMASSFAPQSSIASFRQRRSVLSIAPLRGGSTQDEENSPPPLLAAAVTESSATTSPEVESATSSSPQEETAASDTRLGPMAPPPGLLRAKFPAVPWQLVPNWLTYVRCLAIPSLIAVFYAPGCHVATSALFAVASLTDYLDGFLARRWDITSAFGAFLDPVADKLMVSTSLILLAGRYGARVAIPGAVILARELAVSALREWMAARGLRDIVQVGYQGKVKTALTMAALTLLLLVPADGAGVLGKLQGPSFVLLYLCAAVTVTSGSVYFRAAAPILMKVQERSEFS